jgi:hypothetical protein
MTSSASASVRRSEQVQEDDRQYAKANMAIVHGAETLLVQKRLRMPTVSSAFGFFSVPSQSDNVRVDVDAQLLA